MPFAIPIIATAAIVGAGAAITTSIVAGVVAFAATAAIGFATHALSASSTESVPNLASFSVQARGRVQQVRQAITSWRIVYGEVRVSGPLSFLEATDANRYLHYVLALASHECESLGTVVLDDQPIPDYLMDPAGSGEITDGKFATKVRLKKKIGQPAQGADSNLVNETSATTTDRWQGRAVLYTRLDFDINLFSSIPNTSVVIKGKKVFDPRTSTTVWSNNPALCIRDYLVTPLTNGGLGATTDEIDEQSVIVAANICDEFVNTQGIGHQVVAVVVSDDRLDLNGTALRYQTGDRVRVSTDDTLPAGIAPETDYYVIVASEHGTPGIRLGADYAAALAGTQITIAGGGAGNHQVTKDAEPRYTLNGVVDTNRRPGDVLTDMRSAMGGRIVYIGGKWKLRAAAWTGPAITLDESKMRGPISVRTKIPQRERFNAVKGVYVSPLNNGQAADYPAVTNALYQTQDGGFRAYRDVDLPFTSRPGQAQRLAKIELERARQEITVVVPCFLDAYQVEAGNVVAIDNERFGWSGKEFEVVDLQFVQDDTDAEAPYLGVDLTLIETAAGIFDWNSGEETTVDLAPDTNLPDAFNVLNPGAPVLTEVLYQTRDSAGVKSKAVLTWAPSQDAFVERYRLEYKLSSATVWTLMPDTPANTIEILDIAPGKYDFRVKAINQIGASSEYSTSLNREVLGLLAPPTPPQNLTLVSIGGMAMLSWDLLPDLDVRIGGRVVFRHSSAQTGATWQTSVTIGNAVSGAATVAVLPLKPGTYLAKSVDSSGIGSLTASTVSTAGAQVLEFANLSSISEHPSFSGAHNGTVAVDNTLRLAGASNVDDIADVDAVANWDAESGVLPSGTYDFAAGFDLTTVQRVRLRSKITATVVNTRDTIDDRTDAIDDWEDFDGDVSGEADAQVWVRETPDDPTGSPVNWSAWQRLDSGEFEARGFDLQCRLSATSLRPTKPDPPTSPYNIHVSELTVDVDNIV